MKNSEISYRQTTKTESNEQLLPLRIAFLDVGQADTIVITCPDTHEAIVVDCVDADAVLDYLEAEHITYLRGVIITHLHADHYSGVTSLLSNYHHVPGLQECEIVIFNQVDRKKFDTLVRDPDLHDEGTKYGAKILLSNLLQWCKQGELEGKQRCSCLQVERRPIALDGIWSKILHLLHPHFSDFPILEAKGLNNVSGVFLVRGPGSSALLTGDLEPDGWQFLRENHPNLHSDVLKFPHHGAWKDGDVDSLLDSVQPSIVIISVGSEGYKKYKHPNAHVFEALSTRPHIRVLCTQATDQCQHHVQQKAASVRLQLKAQARQTGFPVIGSKQGCPCAGTIIIELGKEARILQPEPLFHQQSIIRGNFKEMHKCIIGADLALEHMQIPQKSADGQ